MTKSFTKSVGVIDAKERSGERCSLTEADEQRVVNLALGIDEHATEQEHEPANSHDGCDDKLQRCFHEGGC